MTASEAPAGSVDQTGASGVTIAVTGRVDGGIHVTGAASSTAVDRPSGEPSPFRIEPFMGVARPTGELAPSRLLAAANEIVPFYLPGRAADLAHITTWRDADDRLAVHLAYAPGGQGKTRLAGYVAAESAERGWTVLRARHRDEVPVPSQHPDGTGALAHDHGDPPHDEWSVLGRRGGRRRGGRADPA
jgi:hypothetical protein